MSRRFPIALMGTGVLALALAHPAFAQTEPGDLWEVTTSMSGGGMSMPANTQQVCSPKKTDTPAGMPERSDCEMYDMKQSGNTHSWKMRCTGKEPMTASGEMTYEGKDAYRGHMKMNAEGQDMEMKMSGKRIGECDAGKIKRQVAAAMAANAAQMEKSCQAAVDQMSTFMLRPESQMNCDPKYLKQFCGRFSTEEGFDKLDVRNAQPMPPSNLTPIQEAGQMCGTAPEDVRAKLCNNAMGKESLVFVARHCPALADPLAQKECAGRGYTVPVAAKYRDFCSNYSGQLLASETAAPAGSTSAPSSVPAPPANPVDNAVDKGKKLLKGVFGR